MARTRAEDAYQHCHPLRGSAMSVSPGLGKKVPDRAVKTSNVLAIGRDRGVHIRKVIECAEWWGGASASRLL